MNKKILFVKEYVIVENEDDLFFVFDTEFLSTYKNEDTDFNIETDKIVFKFKDDSNIPHDKLKKLTTIGIVVNKEIKGKSKQYFLEGVAFLR